MGRVPYKWIVAIVFVAGVFMDNLDTTSVNVALPTLAREFETGSFYRQFRLSNAVDQGRIDATLENGVLRLTLPKAEAHKPRKVEIRNS